MEEYYQAHTIPTIIERNGMLISSSALVNRRCCPMLRLFTWTTKNVNWKKNKLLQMRKFLIATCPMILIRGTIHLGSFFDWTPYYVYFYGEVEWIMAAVKILHGRDHGLYSSSKTQLTITTKRAVNFGLSSHS